MPRLKTIWYSYQEKDTWKSEYPDGSMYDLLANFAAQHPNLPALEFEGKWTSYKQLLNQIENCSASLANSNIRPTDIITVISPNITQAVILFYAANRLGITVSFLHPLVSGLEMVQAIKSTDSRHLFVLEPFAKKLIEAGLDEREMALVVTLYVSDALPTAKKTLYRLKEKRPLLGITWSSFIKCSKEKKPMPSTAGKSDSVAAIMFSGGTSGSPKGVMLTNKNFNALSLQSYDTMGIRDVVGMKVLAILPVFHGTGLGVCVHSMLCNGICSMLIASFQAKKCVKKIFKYRIEFLFGVPAFYEALVRSKEIAHRSCSFIRVIGSCGDVLPDRTRDAIDGFLKKSGAPCTITNGYGMTECTAGCCYEPYFKKKKGTSGIMVPDMLAKIVYPGTQTEVPIGEEGELCISGPTVMKGYYANDEETRRTLQLHQDEKIWLHTGDCFSIDEEGYLIYKQRLDRMFIVSGFNIYPSNVEKAISIVDGVKQCCVVGQEADVVGKRIVAYIVGEKSSLDKIIAFCKTRLPEYSIPSEWIFIPSLPKTRMGKIDYQSLSKGKIN